jgi:hypothetical protein
VFRVREERRIKRDRSDKRGAMPDSQLEREMGAGRERDRVEKGTGQIREENEVGGGYRWWESGGKVFRVREPEDC